MSEASANGAAEETRLRAAVFSGLAAPSRVALAVELLGGEKRVQQLSEATGLSRANTSHQLGAMWRSGLVARERRGVHVHYRLVPAVRGLLEAADSALAGAPQIAGTARPGSGEAREWASKRRID